MSKRKLVEDTSVTSSEITVDSPLFSPGLTERQQIALAMKLSGESNSQELLTPPRSTKARNINKTNKHGESALQIAAIKGDGKSVKLLIKQGAEVNTRDNAGWSPLHEAANKGYLEVCRTLLKHGALPNVHGLNDETPLHDAASNGHTKVVELLLQGGANPLLRNSSGRTPIEMSDNEQINGYLSSATSNFEIQRDPMSPLQTTSLLQTTSPQRPEKLYISPLKDMTEDCPINESVTVSESLMMSGSVTTSESVTVSGCMIEREPKLSDGTDPLWDYQDTHRSTASLTPVKTTPRVTEEPPVIQPYKYCHLIPETSHNTRSSPITLYVARQKRTMRPLLESLSPPTTRSRAGPKPVDNTEAEELKSLNERYLLKSAVLTPRKKWLHQYTVRRRHLGDIHEMQKRGVVAEPPLPKWFPSSLLYTRQYLLQSNVAGDVDEIKCGIHYLPPVMIELYNVLKREDKIMNSKHITAKERLIQYYEERMLRVRRQAIMRQPAPSLCSLLLQQHSYEYSKKLQTVSYNVNNDQLLLSMGEKVLKNFQELSETLYRRQKQESDAQFSNHRFTWLNDIHKYGLYDMPILGNLEEWISKVDVSKLEPHIVYYEEYDDIDKG